MNYYIMLQLSVLSFEMSTYNRELLTMMRRRSSSYLPFCRWTFSILYVLSKAINIGGATQ